MDSGKYSSQTGQNRSLGIVFVGDWRAKESQQPVAHEPRDGSFVLIDGLDHPGESAVDDLGPFFRIKASGRGRRAFDITEQHGDNPSLAGHLAHFAGGFELAQQFFRDETIQVGRLPANRRI